MPWVQATRPSGVVSGTTSWAAAGEASEEHRQGEQKSHGVTPSRSASRLTVVAGRRSLRRDPSTRTFSRGESMRLCTIMSGGKAVVGVKTGDGKIIDLSKQMPRGPKSVVEILAGGKKVQAEVAKACAKPKAGATVSAKSAKYLCPIPEPGQDPVHRPQLPQACRGDRQPDPGLSGGVLPLRQHAGAAQRQDAAAEPLRPARLGGRAHHRDRQEVPQRAEGEGARRDRAAMPASTTARCATGRASRAASSRWARTSTAPAASAPTS